MSPVQIFVKGVADQKFLQDVIIEWYGVELSIDDKKNKSIDILGVGGKNAFDSPEKLKILTPIFQTLSLTGKPALVIFDADQFLEDKVKLHEHSQKHGFQFFLFPNNQLDGDLEALLEQLINPANQPIFDCWDTYEACLSQRSTSSTESGKFTTPARKTKIYAYLEALLGETDSEKAKIKERNRNYREQRHWNITDADILKPLKEFLDPFFSIPISN